LVTPLRAGARRTQAEASALVGSVETKMTESREPYHVQRQKQESQQRKDRLVLAFHDAIPEGMPVNEVIEVLERLLKAYQRLKEQ
jgi:hypothetical protein